ncbi:MAG TPA: Rieske (2Fe-2S) protein [Dehalococcoidia bacterium]|nr:Rieske (2Fe-2S) protein [Dehalococcoidia bacterium]
MTNGTSPPELKFYTVGKVGDFKADKMRSVKVGIVDVVVLLQDDGWHAFSNYCTHVGALLTAGWINNGQVVCPFHYACFDIKTGDLVSGPGYSTLPIFKIRLEGDDVQVEVPVPADGREPQVRLAPIADGTWSSRT